MVCDLSPQRRRVFEARVPRDATMAELEAFSRRLMDIVSKRRDADNARRGSR